MLAPPLIPALSFVAISPLSRSSAMRYPPQGLLDVCKMRPTVDL